MKTEELVKQILADKRYSHIPQSMIEFCVEFSDSNPDFIREYEKKEKRKRKKVKPIVADYGQQIVKFGSNQDEIVIHDAISFGVATPEESKSKLPDIKEEDAENSASCR